MIGLSCAPKKVLTAIFHNLNRQDVLSCSYTCWQWNAAINNYLYHEIYCSEGSTLELLIRTITPPLALHADDGSETVSRQKQLGQLVQIVKVLPDWSESNAAPWYLPLFIRLSTLTPNVHTATLVNPATRLTTTLAKSNKLLQSVLWETFDTNWSQWKSLTLQGLTGWKRDTSVTNTNALEKLEYLDVSSCTGNLYCLLPSYVMPNLKSLSIGVEFVDDQNYERAKAMVQACGKTLKSLVLKTHGAPLMRLIDLDSFLDAAPNLKSLVIVITSCVVRFTISRLIDIIGGSRDHSRSHSL